MNTLRAGGVTENNLLLLQQYHHRPQSIACNIVKNHLNTPYLYSNAHSSLRNCHMVVENSYSHPSCKGAFDDRAHSKEHILQILQDPDYCHPQIGSLILCLCQVTVQRRRQKYHRISNNKMYPLGYKALT